MHVVKNHKTYPNHLDKREREREREREIYISKTIETIILLDQGRKSLDDFSKTRFPLYMQEDGTMTTTFVFVNLYQQHKMIVYFTSRLKRLGVFPSEPIVEVIQIFLMYMDNHITLVIIGTIQTFIQPVNAHSLNP
jgi:hypothetical protein